MNNKRKSTVMKEIMLKKWPKNEIDIELKDYLNLTAHGHGTTGFDIVKKEFLLYSDEVKCHHRWFRWTRHLLITN
jgi:hypothetical protein